MKLKWNHLLVVVLLLSALVLVTGCAGQETPYEKNDALNYTVSVKYDANGGVFTTSTSVIVDSYNLSELPVDEDVYYEELMKRVATSRRKANVESKIVIQG